MMGHFKVWLQQLIRNVAVEGAFIFKLGEILGILYISPWHFASARNSFQLQRDVLGALIRQPRAYF